MNLQLQLSFFFQKRKILKTNYKSKIDFVMKQNGIKINVI